MQRRIITAALAASAFLGFAAISEAAARQNAADGVIAIYQAEEAALNRPSADLRDALDHYTPDLRDSLAAGFERGRKRYPNAKFAISILNSTSEDGIVTVQWRVTAVALTGAFPTQVSVDCEDQWRNEDGKWVAFSFRRLNPVQVTRAHDSGEAQRMNYLVSAKSLQKWSPLP